MADAYPYPLLVKLEENKTPRLKNKLVIYFQSKKSNGGDCVVDYENGSRTAVVRFHREEDRQNVLEKEVHQITVDKGVLKMAVHLPTDEKTKQETQSVQLNKKPEDETAEEELCSNSAVIGFPDKLSEEFLELLVENVLMDHDSPSSPIFTLEVIPHISSAVVTFQSEKENTDFVMLCPQSKMFKKKQLSVRPLEVTAQVVIEDVKTRNFDFEEDHLRLYFTSEGSDVENVTLNEAEQSAVITFKDPKAVQKIMKKKLHFKNEEIRVYPYYKSLGTALYGKDKPSLKLPAVISVPIDNAVWRYLNHNQSAAETVFSDLAKHFCNVNLQQPTVCLSPVSALLQQKDAKNIIKAWTDTVKSAFAQALLKFKSLKLQLESEIWEESEEKIKQTLLSEDVVVVPDKSSGVLSVVGLVDDVNRLEQTLTEVVNKIVIKVQRMTSSITQEIKVSPSLFHIMCQDGLQDKLLRVYPELKISFRKDSSDLIATGLREEILAAKNTIFDQMLALKRQILEIDNFVVDMLKNEQQEELTDALLTSNNINAAFEINAQRVHLVAVSDRDLNDAADHLRKLLISQYIDVEDSSVLQKPEWKHLISQLQSANSELRGKIQIKTKGQQVVVSGHKHIVIRVGSKLDDYLKQNAEVEEVIVVKPNTIVEYFQKHNTSWMEEVADKVVVSFRKEAICLNGSRVNVTDCKTLVEDSISSVYFERLEVSKPGVKKFFQDKEAMYVYSLNKDTNCLVQLVDETGDGRDDVACRQVQKPVYQLQTSDGVEIAVCQADMCSYPVHAVVSSSTQDLKSSGGLAGALLKAAGPQLQDECDKLINLNGPLKPGDTVITGAGGQLCCKKVIHAVGPSFDAAKPQRALSQLKRAVKGSLDLAEKHGCMSVALPVISRNSGFPLNLCAVTIIKAVKEHCEDRYDDNTLKRIHFVNNDDIAVQAMEAATEVTVNTVFEDLVLNRGAVSNAILRVAGPELQQAVHAKNTSGAMGEVIVTDGCNLKCKQVFHAVVPQWDKKQGTAEKTLQGIFKDCLGKAESSGLTSITFPAIGTGNLGFPKNISSSLMLDEIIAFSKKQPKHLKNIIIVLYPKDAETIRVFTDEFRKNFPGAAGSPAASSSPQSSGPFSKITSSSEMHETQMGAVTVQVVTGDITKETTDVIVNSTNEAFTLKSGVSKAILDAAGQAVEEECRNTGAMPNSGIIMTQPGNLKCKKILHLIGQTDPIKINKFVKNALHMCVTNSYTSVSFPAIGTGQGHVQARQVADSMLDAVIDVLSQNTSSTLKTVRVVIFQKPMLKDFYNSMQQREATDPKDEAGLWGKISTVFKSWFIKGNPDKPQKGDFVIEALEVDAACFHICGDSQTNVDLAKHWINDLIDKEYNSINIPDDSILSFADEDYQCIADIQKTMGVSIRTESKKDQASLTIEGLSKNVLRASNEIHDMLRKRRDEDELKRKENLAGMVADWQYKQQGSQFQSLDSKSNFHLEQALEKKQPNVKITVQGRDYTVTMPSGPATDNQGHTLQIKRIDKLKDEDVPEEWDIMPANATSHAFTLNPASPEYNEVLKMFQATCNNTVDKIERIQNPILWKAIQIKKREMEQRNRHQNNEKRLFHGTSESTVAIINERGFNRAYAGKNAACYGNGTYFAVNASYSASNTYSIPNPQGKKCMYLCRVLTGDYTAGKPNIIVPPAKENDSSQQYDSVVDKMANPSMFVIFHDIQAYPEYLIYFQ
ncbi:hypothetical protein PAMP_004095 [Pampus punctatissimus]